MARMAGSIAPRDRIRSPIQVVPFGTIQTIHNISNHFAREKKKSQPNAEQPAQSHGFSANFFRTEMLPEFPRVKVFSSVLLFCATKTVFVIQIASLGSILSPPFGPRMLSTRTRSKRKATSENPEDKVQISTERTTNGSAEDKNQDTDVDREMAVDLDSLESFSTEPNSLISDQYFLCQSSKSKTTKTVFSTVLGDFNLNEIQISDIIHRDYDSLSAELDVKKNIESMFRKCYHMLR